MKHRLPAAAAAAAATAALLAAPAPATAATFSPAQLPSLNLNVPALNIPAPSLPALPDPQAVIDQYNRFTQQLFSQFAFPLPQIPGFNAPGAPAAQPAASADQQALIDATNRYRVAHGVRPLAPMPQLNAVAQDWANTMAREDTPRHRPDIQTAYPAGWRMARENVLMVNPPRDADGLVAGWSASAGHNANMLDPSLTHIGVGIATAPNGDQYAVQNFATY